MVVSRDLIEETTFSKVASVDAPAFDIEPTTLKDLINSTRRVSVNSAEAPSTTLSSTKDTDVQVEHHASLVHDDVYFGNTLFLEGLPSSVSFDHTDTRGTFVNISLPSATSEVDINLGKLRFCKFISGSRQKVWWMIPGWGKKASEIPLETQFLLMRLTPDGTPVDQEQYAIILPLVSGPFRSALKPGPSGSVILRVETGDSETARSSIDNAAFIAAGPDPYKLLAEGFAAASERVETFKPREGKQLPNYFDVFGYCTWNAFYENVSASGIVTELKSFRDAGVPARTLIIDDGWQDTVNPHADRTAKTAGLGWMITHLTSGVVEWFYWKFVWNAPTSSLWFKLWQKWCTAWPLKNYLAVKWSGEDFAWSRRLRSPEPNAKFLATTRTGKLGDFVSEVKSELGISEVWTWHSLLGYWGGVEAEAGAWPSGSRIEMAKPMESILGVEPQMAWDPLVLGGLGLTPQPAQLYDTIHRSLAHAGVDGVKIDIQAVTTMLGEKRGGSRKVTTEYLQAAEESVRKHFGSSTQMINCMSHASECLYSVKGSSVVRASDDFWPKAPASHSSHIVHVAYNSLFIGEIAQPDWDMFQSKHPAAGLHAAARAVSGGPVYVSDTPGEHNFELLRRLVLPDGAVLRATLPGRPTRDSLFADVTADGHSPLKVWNRNRCNGVLAAFNVQGASWDRVRRDNYMHGSHAERVEGVLRASDVEGLLDPLAPSAPEYVLALLHLAPDGQLLSTSTQTLRADQPLPFALAHRHSLLATVARVRAARAREAHGRLRSVKWAALGLEGMLNGGAAVVSEAETPHAGGAEYAQVEAAGAGTLLLHCDAPPAAVLLDARPLPAHAFHYDPSHHLLRVPFQPRHPRTSATIQVAF
mmetsp:Transcript_37266/g.87980  ORF Transcript_37266/g.87980 Transcript_37266/m.87980 type:complete len:870 (-) Transcript_37266:91-2700(-)